MLTSTILSILLLVLATLTLSLPAPAPAPVPAEVAAALGDIEWLSFPDIPSPNTVSEYNDAVALFRASMANTTADELIFGSESITSSTELFRASEWLLQKCQTSEFSPSVFSFLMAVALLVKRGENGEGCNFGDQSQACTLAQRWGEAGIGRCEQDPGLRGRWLSCGVVASRIQTLLAVEGCVRTYKTDTKRIGGVVSFQWSVFDRWSDLNLYYIADMVPGK